MSELVKMIEAARALSLQSQRIYVEKNFQRQYQFTSGQIDAFDAVLQWMNTPVTGKVLLTKEQHWLQELRPGGVGWIDYDEMESRETGEQRLVEWATTKPHRTFRYVLRTIIDAAIAGSKGTARTTQAPSESPSSAEPRTV